MIFSKLTVAALLVLAISPLISVISTNRVQAQSADRTQSQSSATRTTGGITISPAINNVDIKAGQESADFKFSVTNNTSETQRFQLSLVDFGSLDDSGGILFAGEGSQKLDSRYGLAKWADLEEETIDVAAGNKGVVTITIKNSEDLKPGGHYGAVMVRPISSGDKEKVQVNQVSTALMFVRKQGGEQYKLGLKEYEIKTGIFNMPGDARLKFRNDGTVHVVPRGTVTVRDPQGKLVAQGAINTGSGAILPGTERQMDVELQKVGSSKVPGNYTVEVSHRYDDQESMTIDRASFLYVHGWYVAGLAVFVVPAAALIVHPRSRQAFTKNNRISDK